MYEFKDEKKQEEALRILRSIDERLRPRSDSEVLRELSETDPDFYQKVRQAKLVSTSLEDVVSEHAKRKGYKNVDDMMKEVKLGDRIWASKADDKGVRID